MKTILRTFFGIFGALLGPVAVADETTTLSEMLEKVQDKPNVSVGMRSLVRDWVGDISDEDSQIERMRLEKGLIVNGKIQLLRTYPDGSNLGSDAPV